MAPGFKIIVYAMEGDAAVNPFRGILMFVAAGIAFWRGWQIHHGHYAWMAYGLGVVALALGVWHLASGDRRRLR